MPSWFEVGNIWKILREVDLRPIRAEAEESTRISVVGDDADGTAALVAALSKSPTSSSPSADPGWSFPALDHKGLSDASPVMPVDLVVLLMSIREEQRARERELFEGWRSGNRRMVLIYDRLNPPNDVGWFIWSGDRILGGSPLDRSFVEHEFVSAVLSLLPERQLSIARHYPLFRIPVAQQLIAETSMANASYSLGTGLAEIVPILDIPFNVADMIILTKAQAIMCYKLGLALGLSGNWRDHMAAFGGSVGSGFLWRQIARQLVGLIPVWGIVPKVAVSYAGTYVLGQAILQWYLTGSQITPAVLRKMYMEALDQGRAAARTLVHRKPGGRKRKLLPARAIKTCGNCGSANPGGFNYCGKCGTPLQAVS